MAETTMATMAEMVCERNVLAMDDPECGRNVSKAL
jgi:hypothetical protein